MKAHLSDELRTPDFTYMEELALWASQYPNELEWQYFHHYSCVTPMKVQVELDDGSWQPMSAWATELHQSQNESGVAKEISDCMKELMDVAKSAQKPPKRPKQTGRGKPAYQARAVPIPLEDDNTSDSYVDVGQPQLLADIESAWLDAASVTQEPKPEANDSNRKRKHSQTEVEQSTPAAASSSAAKAAAPAPSVCLTVDARGVVWNGARRVGRMTEVNVHDVSKHSFSIYCSLHRSCSTMRRMKALPFNAQERILQWMEFGLSVATKEEHMNAFQGIVMK